MKKKHHTNTDQKKAIMARLISQKRHSDKKVIKDNEKYFIMIKAPFTGK